MCVPPSFYGQWDSRQPPTRRWIKQIEGMCGKGGKSGPVYKERESQRDAWGRRLVDLSTRREWQVDFCGRDTEPNWNEKRREDKWPEGLVLSRVIKNDSQGRARSSELASRCWLESCHQWLPDWQRHLVLVVSEQDDICCLCPGQRSVAFTKQLLLVSVKPSPKEREVQLGQQDGERISGPAALGWPGYVQTGLSDTCET